MDLSQSPAQRPRSANSRGVPPVIACGSRWLYLPHARRCLSPVELLAAQGLPVSDALAMGVSQVSFKDLSATAPARIAGNGMHASCIGAILAWIGRYGHQPHEDSAFSVPTTVGPASGPLATWIELGQCWSFWVSSPERWDRFGSLRVLQTGGLVRFVSIGLPDRSGNANLCG